MGSKLVTMSSNPNPTTTTSSPPIQSETEPEPNPTQNDAESNEEENDDEEEEEGECGFCVFMKGGGCKDQFIAWENCVEQSEKNNEDIVQKCFEATAALKNCMEAHSEYYEPVLKAEKAASEQEVAKDNELKKVEEEKSVTIEVTGGGSDAEAEAGR